MNSILVLMSTYNGEKYLKEQIDSVLSQKNVNLSILVRDDGSNDDTLSILNEYKKKKALNYYVGENIGPAKSFMDLIIKAPKFDYYAFCDQDDVWLPNKLEKAISKLKNVKGSALFYHGMDLVDSSLNKYDYYFQKKKNSESIAYSCLFGSEIAGCTMVFNDSLLKMVKHYSPKFITMHDSWIHRVCLCVNGTIICDETSYIKYRQHDNNVVGIKKRKLLKKLQILLRKEKKFSRLANEMIVGYSDFLTNDNLKLLKKITNYKNFREKIEILKIAKKVCTDNKKLLNLQIKLLLNTL